MGWNQCLEFMEQSFFFFSKIFYDDNYSSLFVPLTCLDFGLLGTTRTIQIPLDNKMGHEAIILQSWMRCFLFAFSFPCPCARMGMLIAGTDYGFSLWLKNHGEFPGKSFFFFFFSLWGGGDILENTYWRNTTKRIWIIFYFLCQNIELSWI